MHTRADIQNVLRAIDAAKSAVIRADLSCEMWFEQSDGLRFKVTVQARNATSEEINEMARMNWDAITREGARAISARP